MKRKTITVLSILTFLFLWQFSATLTDNQLVFPTFTATLQRLFELCRQSIFWQSVFHSMLRVFAGFFISIFLGTITGVLCGLFPSFRDFCAFPLTLIRSVPAVSFILLAVFIFSSDFVPVFSAVLMAFPVMTSAVSAGFNFTEDDKKLFFMADVFRLTKTQKIRFILLPKLQSFIESGIFSTFGMTWKVVVAAEVLSIPKKALGALLQTAQVQLESATLLSATLVLVALSFAFENLLHLAFLRLFSALTSLKQPIPSKKSRKPLYTLPAEVDFSSVKVQNLNIKYGEKTLFQNFGFEFEKNKITAILAPSGSGKTTLLNRIAQTEKSLSFLFQEPRLLPSLSIYQNVYLPLSNFYAPSRAQKISEDYLKATKLFESRNKKVQNLSGGEKQRVAMARSFAFPSKILLLDEAFQSLDLKIKRSLEETLKKLLISSPRTVIFVTHEKQEALDLAQVIIEMDGEPMKIKRISKNPKKTALP